jgi:hypothetical protein
VLDLLPPPPLPPYESPAIILIPPTPPPSDLSGDGVANSEYPPKFGAKVV